MSIYGTLTDANTYHADRGNAAWAAATESARNAALIRATDYIDGRYRYPLPLGRWQSAFVGERTAGRAQDREWPRVDAVDYEGNDVPSDSVPIEIERATYEAALREVVTPGSLSPDFVASQQTKREKVDVIEVEYFDRTEGANGSPPNRPIIPAIDELVAPLLRVVAYLPAVRVV